MIFERHSIAPGTELITVYDSASNLIFESCNYGAKITHWSSGESLNNQLIIANITYNQLFNHSTACNEVLFPFPNRLDKGQYEWEGKTFQFPINEKEHNNAIHGFIRSEYFEKGNVEQKEGSIKIEYSTSSKKRAYYSFNYKLTVSYEVFSNSSLKVEFKVQSTDLIAQPVAIGWHPYFYFDKEGATITLQNVKEHHIGNRYLPNGITTDYAEMELVCTQPDMFNRHFEHEAELKHIKLSNTEYCVDIELIKGFKFLQVFTAKNSDQVAIEPMSCMINGLQTGKGIQALNPGETLEFSCLLKISKK